MKTLVACAIITLACFIVLIISLRDSASTKSVFHNGKECDVTKGDNCPPGRPYNYNVEKGVVYDSNIIQTERFELWTILFIWMESSARYCNHLAHVQSGIMKDAQDYLALFTNSTSYYFATTFTNPIDNACNPDNDPDQSDRMISGLWLAVSICWAILLSVVCYCKDKFEANDLKTLKKFAFTATVAITMVTAGMYMASHYPYCYVHGNKCWVAPTGIVLHTRMGTFENFTCNNTSCGVTWKLQGSNDALENPNGTCVEMVDIGDTFHLPSSKPLLLNPSTKTECRAVPPTWNTYGWISFLLVSFPCVLLFLAGCMFVAKFVHCRIWCGETRDRDLSVKSPLLQ
jgi:hypothetical protein